MLVEAAREELVPGVDGGLLRLVHEVELLLEAQSAGVGACLEGLVPGEDSPLDLRLESLILEGPDIAGQLGAPPLGGVLEGGFVVSIPQLPGGGSDPHVLHHWLALSSHLRLVHNTAVLAPSSLHDADCVLASAVAVLLLQVDDGGRGDLGIVAGYDFPKVGHGSIAQLHCVSIEDLPEGVARGEALVHQLEKLAAKVGFH